MREAKNSKFKFSYVVLYILIVVYLYNIWYFLLGGILLLSFIIAPTIFDSLSSFDALDALLYSELVVVYEFPSKFQILMLLSSLPDTRYLLSGLIATVDTSSL